MSMSNPKQDDMFEMKISKMPAVNMVEGTLPESFMTELNSHIDEHRGKMNDYSDHLVGQIKQNEKSQQLELDRTNPTVQGLIQILSAAGRTLISSYSDQLILDQKAFKSSDSSKLKLTKIIKSRISNSTRFFKKKIKKLFFN